MNVLLITLFVGAVAFTLISAVRKERTRQRVQVRQDQQRQAFFK